MADQSRTQIWSVDTTPPRLDVNEIVEIDDRIRGAVWKGVVTDVAPDGTVSIWPLDEKREPEPRRLVRDDRGLRDAPKRTQALPDPLITIVSSRARLEVSDFTCCAGPMTKVYLDEVLLRIMCQQCGRQPIDLLKTQQPSITCPRCGRTSSNINDIAQGYCGACSWWTSDPDLAPHHPEGAPTVEAHLPPSFWTMGNFDTSRVADPIIPGETEELVMGYGKPKRPDPTKPTDGWGQPLPQPGEPTMDLLHPEVDSIGGWLRRKLRRR